MQNTSLNTITYLLIILHKSLTKASEELWLAPHQCSPAALPFLYFQVFHPRGYRRTTVLIFAHHQLALSVGTICLQQFRFSPRKTKNGWFG